jgi:hypothetical protein
MLATGTADVTVDCVESLSLDAEYNMNQFETASATGTVTVTEKPAYIRGDVNGDNVVDDNDAIHLLLYTLFGSADYPVNQNCDMNGDGVEDDNDAIHLLLYTLFGSADYPLS